jgi:HEAT repeat protein
MKTPIAFVAVIIAASAAAQTNEQLQKQHDELKAAVHRMTFEQGAYAEEHERDFEKASKLYRDARTGASNAGDTALAGDAQKALDRVEARLGKGTDTSPSRGQDIPIAVQRRLYILVKQLSGPPEGEHKSDSKNYEAMNQLTPFGASAVPILERALHSENVPDPDDAAVLSTEDLARLAALRQTFTDDWPPLRQLLENAKKRAESPNPAMGNPGFRGNTKWAARTLAQIEAPEAAAALGRGIKSPDPFVKLAIIGELNSTRHRAILDEALTDPTLEARAMIQLSHSKDPALLELMRAAALRTDREVGPAAMKWLVRNRPEEAVAVAKAGKISVEALGATIDEILGEQPGRGWAGRSVPQQTRAEIDRRLGLVVEIAEGLGDLKRILVLVERLNRFGGGSGGGGGAFGLEKLDAGLKARLEAALVKRLPEAVDGEDRQPLLTLLGKIGGMATARALLEPEGRPVDDASIEAIRAIVRRSAPEEFVETATVYRSVTARLADKRERLRLSSQLFVDLRALAKHASPGDLVAALNGIPEDQRTLFINEVILKLTLPPVEALVVVLRAGDEEARLNALEWLRKNGAAMVQIAGVVPPLDPVVVALSDPSHRVRQAAVDAFSVLVDREPKRGAELVAAALKTSMAEPTPELIYTLNQFRAEEAMPLIESLWTSAPARRETLMTVALQVPGDAANAFLVKNFDAIPEDERSNAVDRFGNSVYEPAIDVIGSQLSSRNEGVRLSAQRALEVFRKQREALEEFRRWKAGDAEARSSISELLKLLESPNKDVVSGAVRALGAVKAQAALPALVKLLERQDPALKAAVDEAIKKIGE